jgi:crotonobetainyl-CoA:carnitine CoA-transferase CaiB-like acyl-CoA transferase
MRRLAGWADVLVENNRPGDMEERGFGYRHAAEEYPALIWCSITGWGQDGPYARWPGHDITYTAHSGLLCAMEPDIPWHPRAMLAVPVGAMMAATGIASALYERARTGRGRHLDISLAESTTWLLAGNDSQFNPPSWGVPVTADRRMYKCSDGRYVTVAAAEPRTWSALCTGLGLGDLAETRPGGADPEQAATRIGEVFATRPASDWLKDLGPLGATIGSVNTGADLLHDPHVRARGSLAEVAGVTVPLSPIRLRDTEGARTPDPGTPPPAVGANTEEMLSAVGYTTEQIDELRLAGVVAG